MKTQWHTPDEKPKLSLREQNYMAYWRETNRLGGFIVRSSSVFYSFKNETWVYYTTGKFVTDLSFLYTDLPQPTEEDFKLLDNGNKKRN